MNATLKKKVRFSLDVGIITLGYTPEEGDNIYNIEKIPPFVYTPSATRKYI